MFFLAIIITYTGCRPMKEVEESPGRLADRRFYADFSQKLGYKLNGTENPGLLREVAGWLGTPHRLGGTTRQGVDCSGFVGEVFRVVFKITLPRTSADMAIISQKIETDQLREGDLVFFNTGDGTKITHVGIYLSNHRFVHASSTLGVIVSSLNESFYRRTFSHAGRIN
ncbi:MAG TPA: NlpC/P60 family protein [Bacteroidales bacterium]|nr:NlpC/P60 family protein [Bacteroidales bacterium]